MIEKYFPQIIEPIETFFREDGFCKIKTDRYGIAIVDYRYQGIGKQYSPICIAQYALSNYNAFIDAREEKFKQSFIKNAEWLKDNFVDKDRFGIWAFKFDYQAAGYKCKSPWASAMAQGQGISTMIRAYDLTRDEEYLEIISKALNAFEVPVLEGGVLKINRRGEWWYEEYACEKAGSPLNGFIYALLGIYELYKYARSYKAKDIFNKGLKTIKKHLKDYELDIIFFKWTRYDNKKLFYAGPKYHDIHIEQMFLLYKITGDEIFYDYHKRWKVFREKYSNSRTIKLLLYIYRTTKKIRENETQQRYDHACKRKG